MAKELMDCGLCELKNMSNLSEAWCPNCGKGICSECIEHHSLSKASRDHKIIPIEKCLKMAIGPTKISQFCEKHHQKYQTFCKKHDTPCCKRCVIESHNGCEELVALDDIVKNIKKSNALDEVEMKLNEVFENVQRIVNNRKQNVKDLNKERHNIEKSISHTRQQINDRLDKLQCDLLNDLYTAEKIEEQQMLTHISKLEHYEAEIKEFQATLERIKHNASNIQIFLAIKKIESNLSEKENLLQTFVKGDKIEYKSLMYKTDATIQRLLDDRRKFGEINIEATMSTVSMMISKNRAAQMTLRPLTSNSSIDNIILTKQRVIKINSEDVTDCIMFPCGRTAFSCDTRNRILVYKAKGKIDYKIKLPNRSFDITYIKDDHLAVSSNEDKFINIVNIKSKKVTDTIPVETDIFGITYTNGEVIYCTRQGIKALNLNNKRTRDIINISLPYYTYITTYRDKLLFTNYDTDSVTCCSMDGDVIWKFKDELVLLGPRGISTDNNGNVYVLDSGFLNLVVISPDGKRYRQLVRDKEGIDRPWSLYYHRTLNQILVGCYYRKQAVAVLYCVTYE